MFSKVVSISRFKSIETTKPWYKKYAEWCRKRGTNRMILNRDGTGEYLERFYLVPRWLTLGLVRLVIHRFWASDEPTFHSHPWLFWGTRILEGGYTEHTPEGDNIRKPGDGAMKSGWATHWVELPKDANGKNKEVWTLFLMGPKFKGWGFMDKLSGIEVPWEKYLEGKAKIEAEVNKKQLKRVSKRK